MEKKKSSEHRPVLLEEVLSFLEPKLKDGILVVDATFGQGGHSREILRKMNGRGKLIALDLDAKAKIHFEKIVKEKKGGEAIFIQENFKEIGALLKNEKKADFILADLGWRMEQMTEEDYGLSFFSQTSLSMRLDGQTEGLTAEQVVNKWPEKDLAKIFWDYGEEKYSRLAARAIVQRRKEKFFIAASELADLIKEKLGCFYRRSKLHPATKVFQALRIFVNNETENLKIFLSEARDCLEKGGRLAIITFHSGEDRIVKNFFRTNARGCICPVEFPKCICGRKPEFKILTTKPALSSVEERVSNPRSRSAKLRVVEKI